MTYLTNVREEFKNVTWPSKAETRRLTVYVVSGSLLVGLFVFVVDSALVKGLLLFIK